MSKPMVVECRPDIAEPRIAPMWISGPSGPTGSPAATTSEHDQNLTMKVHTLRSLGTRTPFRKAMICGTPDAEAAGEILTTRMAATRAAPAESAT